MSEHFREVCKHGVIVNQCRCPGPKTTRLVACPPECATLDIYPAGSAAGDTPEAQRELWGDAAHGKQVRE